MVDGLVEGRVLCGTSALAFLVPSTLLSSGTEYQTGNSIIRIVEKLPRQAVYATSGMLRAASLSSAWSTGCV